MVVGMASSGTDRTNSTLKNGTGTKTRPFAPGRDDLPLGASPIFQHAANGATLPLFHATKSRRVGQRAPVRDSIPLIPSYLPHLLFYSFATDDRWPLRIGAGGFFPALPPRAADHSAWFGAGVFAVAQNLLA